MDEPLWTAKEVADFLNASRDSVWDMVQAGRSPYIRLGNGRLRFRPAAIRAWGGGAGAAAAAHGRRRTRTARQP